MIELHVVLVGEFCGFARPQRLSGVDSVKLLAVSLSRQNGDWQEAAILLQETVNARLLQKLFVVIVDIKNDVGAARLLVILVELIFRRTIAYPFHALCALFVAERYEFHLFGHHERRVEAQAEMADYAVGVFAVFLQKILCAGERYLIDVAVNLISIEADAVVGDCKSAGFLVYLHSNLQRAKLTFEVAETGQSAQFLTCVYAIADQLAQKDFMIGIEELLDDRKNVVGGYTDFALCHNINVFFFFSY